VRQSWTGPRLAGAFLLAGSVAILIGVTSISGRGGYGTSGPRFVPLIVAIGLIALSALYLARTFIRPDVALARRSAEEDAVTHWATPGLIMAALLAYAFLLEPIGYPLATAGVFVVIARLLGSRSIVRDVLVGLVLGFGLYTAFTQYLGVSLPAGLTPIF
jgi:putative tricarboxylic transport membrane protein